MGGLYKVTVGLQGRCEIRAAVEPGSGSDSISSMAALDAELAGMLDMPLFNDGAKRFIGEWHKRNTLQYKPTPHYTVDLDQPPAQRWKHVVADFTEELPRARTYLDQMVKQTEAALNPKGNWFKGQAIKLAFMCGGDIRERAVALCEANPAIELAEIEAVAALAGFSVPDFCLLQIAYELSASCTSVVAPLSTGDQPCHARTMDWGTLFLRELAIQVQFVRGEEPLFVASTWCGYLGILTGMRPNGWSVSINYRSGSGQIGDNFDAGKDGAWPIGFLIRDTLSTVSTYEKAIAVLQDAPLMAPTYITIAGVQPGEAICLSRTRDGFKKECQQTMATPRQLPIVQTNVDCKTEHQHRDSRRSAPRRVCSVFYL